MYKVIIFDLDQTLIDSSIIEPLRKKRDWTKVMQSLHQIKHLDQLKQLVSNLHKAGIKIGIVTNSPRMYASAVLDHFGFPYDVLVAYHDVKSIKPNPEAFLLVLTKLGLSCEDCLNVGDHDNDIIAGQKANITSVGVKWFSSDYNFSTNPHLVFSELKEFENFLTAKK